MHTGHFCLTSILTPCHLCFILALLICNGCSKGIAVERSPFLGIILTAEKRIITELVLAFQDITKLSLNCKEQKQQKIQAFDKLY